MSRRFILTADETRAAEATVIAAGTSVEALMERAGQAAAEAVWRYAGPLPALVLCGPGNNGGDGYVIARVLRERGVSVRVAALAEPQGPATSTARANWGGDIEEVTNAAPAPLLIDALFGTGLTRSLDDALCSALARLAEAARVRVAIDLPSGAFTDDGRLLSPVPSYDLTITFGSLKPSHLLQPAARHMGRIVVADIGVATEGRLQEISRPRLLPPGPDDHKYTRGYVVVVAGEMAGAGALAAAAAAHAGAGYVRLTGSADSPRLPYAVVRGNAPLDDGRIGAIAVGSGLGTGAEAASLLETALASGRPLVLDADAITLLGRSGRSDFCHLCHIPILTPHAGEFERLFPLEGAGKTEQARRAAASSGAVVVFKGADTVVASPDGRAGIAPPASHWLASAGTGDVLTGIVAAMRARGVDAFEAACAGVWLHGRAAALSGPGLVADDLIGHLPLALAECA
jgi:hydroxyethylthiazole kinase-like uncharacterized protein yjeF